MRILVILCCLFCSGCCTTKLMLTMNKTIELDARPINNSFFVGLNLEIMKDWSKKK